MRRWFSKFMFRLAAVAFLSLGNSAWTQDRISTVQKCEQETFEIALQAVCPLSGDVEGMKYFEDVGHPLLSIEAVTTLLKPSVSEPLMAGFGPSLPALGRSNDRQSPLLLLKTLDLLTENLFPPAAHHLVTLNYGNGFLNETPALISFFVCDSSASTACGSESAQNQLTAHIPTFNQCAIPKVVSIPVWAGCR